MIPGVYGYNSLFRYRLLYVCDPMYICLAWAAAIYFSAYANIWKVRLIHVLAIAEKLFSPDEILVSAD